jgi:hypothetical protein
MLNNSFPRKFCPLWDEVEKFDRASQTTDNDKYGAEATISLPDI